MKVISRPEAIKMGLKRYFTGQPCKHGHVSERGVGDRGCIECLVLAKRKCLEDRKALSSGVRYVSDTPCKNGHVAPKLVADGGCVECHRLRAQEYSNRNRERLNSINRERFLKDPTRQRRANRDWAKRHPHECYLRNVRRREQIAATPAEAIDKIAILIMYRAAKVIRQTGWFGRVTVDHIVPLSKGGWHTHRNLQILTDVDNSRKGVRINLNSRDNHAPIQ